MNILFFLIPKHEVAYLEEDFTLRQALEKMEYHRYSAIPIINHNGEYVATITEGDILWYCKSKKDFDLLSSEDTPLMDVSRHADYSPVTATSNIEDLISKAMNQNFIPVVDDSGKFIGIITRRDIIQYCYNKPSLPINRGVATF